MQSWLLALEIESERESEGNLLLGKDIFYAFERWQVGKLDQVTTKPENQCHFIFTGWHIFHCNQNLSIVVLHSMEMVILVKVTCIRIYSGYM